MLKRYVPMIIRCYATKSPLHQFHIRNGGKLVEFGGFQLPIQYRDASIISSHLSTRNSGSIFDVSHMLQTNIQGKGAQSFLESLTPANLAHLKPNSGTLTVLTNSTGGIIDDLIIMKLNTDEDFFIVSNACCRQQDSQYLLTTLSKFNKYTDNSIKLRFMKPEEQALVALQGPNAVRQLQRFTDINLNDLYFMNTIKARIGDVNDCRISRCGYTGEDGVELSIPAHKADGLVTLLLTDQKDSTLTLAGLGTRDTLRIEAGLCLYGQDITSDRTPVEANLKWLINKHRLNSNEYSFPGSEIIAKQLQIGSKIHRIGFTLDSGDQTIPSARTGCKIYNEDMQEIGWVTSGCPSPVLQKNIGMGYVRTKNFQKNAPSPGKKIFIEIRRRQYIGEITKMPFVKTNYFTQKIN